MAFGATLAAPQPPVASLHAVAAQTPIPDTTWAQPGALRASTSAQLYALRFHLAQEFRTLASLRHPNIVSVLDYGFDAEQKPFFTMELLDNAEQLHTAARELSTTARLQLILQILQALIYLHRRGIIHRDLKPANVLVTKDGKADGDGLRVKLLDFGLAVLRQRQTLQAGEISGTLGYIAPEVLLGAQATELADLYSVGVMTYELLSGSRPVPAAGVTGHVQAALSPAPIILPVELPAELTAVLSRLLAHDLDVVAGLYPTKRSPPSFFFTLAGDEYGRIGRLPSGLVEAEEVALGEPFGEDEVAVELGGEMGDGADAGALLAGEGRIERVHGGVDAGEGFGAGGADGDERALPGGDVGADGVLLDHLDVDVVVGGGGAQEGGDGGEAGLVVEGLGEGADGGEAAEA